MISSQNPWDSVENLDLGDGLGQRELFFWSEQRGRDNLYHKTALKHRNFCPQCKNCLCDDLQTRWRCRCADGKVQITPYRIRYRQETGQTAGPYRIRSL